MLVDQRVTPIHQQDPKVFPMGEPPIFFKRLRRHVDHGAGALPQHFPRCEAAGQAEVNDLPVNTVGFWGGNRARKWLL